MASPLSDETELLRTIGNQLNHTDMTQLADGRIVSVGQSVRDVLIRITDPATGNVTELPALQGDDLRGAPHAALPVPVVHTLHNVAVAALPDGGFVIAAQLNQNIGGSYANYEQIIYMQRFNADGSLRGSHFRARDPDSGNPLDQGGMNTTDGQLALIEHPEGVVLAFRQVGGSDPNRPGLILRFFDTDGTMQADHRLHNDRAHLPQAVVVEGDELLVVWFEGSEGSIMWPNEYVPPALAYQSFALDGTPLTGKTRIDNGPGGEHMKLLQTPDGGFKLLYLAISNPVQDSQIETGSGGLMMATFDAAMNQIGSPVLLLGFDAAPAGDGRWRMEGLDAALDAQGGFTVALQTNIIESAGQSDTREDIFVAGFNLDGSLRSAPVQATETARGIQRDPVLVTQEDGTLYLQFMQFERPEISGATQLMGVSIDPDIIIDPIKAIELGLRLPEGIGREDVLVTFRSDDGETEFTAIATEDGYRFEISSAQAQGLSGRIEISKDYSPGTGDPAITASDALDVLRMAVGLAPSFGVAAAPNFIAADLNGDGVVDALDALEVLRAAVGLASAAPPRWVFLDVDLDVSQITAQNVSYQTGIAVPDFSALGDLDMTGILLGHMGLPT